MKTLCTVVMSLFISLSVLADSDVLNSRLAGSWYPKNKKTLEKQIQNYLGNVKIKIPDNVIALVLPHAGYAYSGQVAAYGAKVIQGRKYSTVIVLGPSHYAAMSNSISVPGVKYYATPLGKVPLDTLAISKLKKYSFVKSVDHLHIQEHSIQIELPFLQYVLKDFKLLPVIVGQLDEKGVKKVAKVIRGLINNDTLVVASTDFTHYGKRFGYTPFANNFETGKKLEELDAGAIEAICQKNSRKFSSYLKKTEATICGSNPLKVLIELLPDNAKLDKLKYDTSGRMMNDYTNSVSYAAIAVTGKWKPVKNKTATLTEDEKKTLLKLARSTIKYFLKHKKYPTPKQLGIKITPDMRKQMGVFVTLHKDDSLRGCIGVILPIYPLYKAVIQQAVNSALNDYRFRNVTKGEMKDIDIEISVLTPPYRVKSYKDIVLGRDGIILRKDGRSAVFLPQVATEQDWDLSETLTYLSRKAGLKPKAWMDDDCVFMVFQAIVFGEKEKK